jgi:hypothetical protein
VGKDYQILLLFCTINDAVTVNILIMAMQARKSLKEVVKQID